MTDTALQTPGDIVAGPGRYYRNARYLIVAGMLACAAWFAYDGWVAWPAELSAFSKMTAEQQAGAHRPHSEWDIELQHRLAIGLAALAPVMLAWFLYRSRGVFRLSGDTLHAPGHPPVALASITEIDLGKWKRKGIARASYAQDGVSGRITLDDFIYDQEPIDAIVARIEKALAGPAVAPHEPLEHPATEELTRTKEV